MEVGTVDRTKLAEKKEHEMLSLISRDNYEIMSRGPHGTRHGVQEQIDLSMALEGPSFLLLSQTCPVSSTSLHHYRPGIASEKALAP